jgi:hypothetical protein
VVVDATGEVFGEAPNVAARVQALADPGTVLITARVQRQVAGLFVAEDRGAHALNGAPEPSVSSTINRSARRTRSPRPAAVPMSPFIKARSSSRVRSGADNLCIGMLPGAPGANRKPAFLLRFR